MADFIHVDSIQNGRTAGIAHARQTFDGRGADVEATGFEHHGDKGQPGEHIVPRVPSRLPKAVMGRVRAIMAAKGVQAPLNEHEMHRLFSTDGEPVCDEVAGKARAKAARNVKGQVNCREFDMRKGMHHRDFAGE